MVDLPQPEGPMITQVCPSRYLPGEILEERKVLLVPKGNPVNVNHAHLFWQERRVDIIFVFQIGLH